jgi:hypothetical protein
MQLTFLRTGLQIKEIYSQDVATRMGSACKFNVSFLYSVSLSIESMHTHTHSTQQKLYRMNY